MNKSGFISELQNQTGYSQEQCVLINDVLESHFIFRKKNRPKVVADIMERLAVDEAEAEKIFDVSVSIIRTEKNSALRHPFGKR